MQGTLDNFSWHTPILDVTWPFFGAAAAAALVGALLGGLYGRVFGNVSWQYAAAGTLLAVVLCVSLVLLHAKWAVLFLLAIGLTAAVFRYESKQRHSFRYNKYDQAADESFRHRSPEVSRRAILVLSIGYAMLAGAAVALVNLT